MATRTVVVAKPKVGTQKMTLSDRFTLLRNQQDAVLGRRGNLTGISAKNRTAAQETRLRQQRQNAVAARRQNLKGRGPGGAKMPAPVAKNGSAAGTRGGKAGRGRGGARAGGRGGKAARGNNKPERRPEAQQKKTKKQKKQKGPKGPKGGKAGAGAGGGDVSLAELDAQLASYNHEAGRAPPPEVQNLDDELEHYKYPAQPSVSYAL